MKTLHSVLILSLLLTGLSSWAKSSGPRCKEGEACTVHELTHNFGQMGLIIPAIVERNGVCDADRKCMTEEGQDCTRTVTKTVKKHQWHLGKIFEWDEQKDTEKKPGIVERDKGGELKCVQPDLSKKVKRNKRLHMPTLGN